jgi:hypothetical protein
MTDHANELRRHARKIPHPQGETPGVMLRAADEIECLRAKVEAAEKERDWHAERCEDAMNECDALRAKITEMEKQEPAGEVVHNGESAGLYDILKQGTLLYTIPGAQPALTPSAGAESRGCGSCKHWINERRTGDKEGSGSCDRVPMQWQAEPDDALAFVTDGELYFAQLRTMPSFFCAHFEAVTPSAENSSTSPGGRAAGPTASDLP